MTPQQAIIQGTIPDWEDCCKMIAAHLEQQGRTFVTIALDPQTKEIAWDYGWQEDAPAQ